MVKSYHVADRLYPVNTPVNNVYYFSKNGSSTNDGRTSETALLSPDECITKINALTGGDVPSAVNRYSVVCLDAGYYTLGNVVNYTDPRTGSPTVLTASILEIPSYVDVEAPMATFKGLVVLNEFSSINLGESECEADGIADPGTQGQIVGSNFMYRNNSLAVYSPIYVDVRKVTTRAFACSIWDAKGVSTFYADEVVCNAPYNVGATIYSAGLYTDVSGVFEANIGTIRLSSNYSKGLYATTGTIVAIVGSLYKSGSPTNTFGIYANIGALINAHVPYINAATAVFSDNSSSAATVNLYSSTVVGSLAANGSGANGVLNIVNTAGDTVLNGTFRLDNIKIDGNTITSENTNGDISLTPNGSGEVNITKVDIDAGTIDGTTLGGASAVTITNATIATVDNITINGDSITDATNDLTVEASGATKDLLLKAAADVVLDPASNNNPKVDISGTEYTMPYTVPIQAFSTVGNVGDTSQFLAGYTGWTIAELENFFGAGKIYSYNKFATGALGTDTNGAYDYTMGAAAKAPSDGTGIEGVAGTAISFDGGDYATNATKFDVFGGVDGVSGTFGGADKGLIHSLWIKQSSDGQPASTNTFVWKQNGANDYYYIALTASGNITVVTKNTGLGAFSLNSTTIFANSVATPWTHLVVCWDTTYGLRLFVNRVNEATNSSAVKLMYNGTTTDYYIGGEDTTPTNPVTGLIAQEIIINKVAEQRDIDILFATTRPEPAVLAGKEYTVIAKVQPEADTKYEYQENAPVLAKYAAKIFVDGRAWGEADKVKLEAIVL